MELVVVGNHAGMPAPGHPSSGYLARTATTAILLDCGPGVAGALPAVAHPWDLDAVLVSHLHLDHCYDLLVLGKRMVHQALAEGGPRAPVPLHVPPGGAAALRALNALFPVGHPGSPLDHVFDVAFSLVEYPAEGTFAAGEVRVRTAPMRHALPCAGFRLESAEGSLVFSGDTGTTDVLVGLAAGADLLLCEATLREPDQTGHGHLSAAEAGAVAAAADVGELVLTHLTRHDPGWYAGLAADARSAFRGPVSVSRPGYAFVAGAARPRGSGVRRHVEGLGSIG